MPTEYSCRVLLQLPDRKSDDPARWRETQREADHCRLLGQMRQAGVKSARFPLQGDRFRLIRPSATYARSGPTAPPGHVPAVDSWSVRLRRRDLYAIIYCMARLSFIVILLCYSRR